MNGLNQTTLARGILAGAVAMGAGWWLIGNGGAGEPAPPQPTVRSEYWQTHWKWFDQTYRPQMSRWQREHPGHRSLHDTHIHRYDHDPDVPGHLMLGPTYGAPYHGSGFEFGPYVGRYPGGRTNVAPIPYGWW